VYGRSKLGAEHEALAGAPGASVIRTSWLCGLHGPNFVSAILRAAARPGELTVVADQQGCPTFTADLAFAIRALVMARLPGIFHVTNQGATTWYHLARATLAAAGDDPDRVRPITTAELVPARPARRPAYGVLDNAALRLSGLALLDDHHEPLIRLVKELKELAG
jgi:dTDP-4-dehydrorhamnose reductase